MDGRRAEGRVRAIDAGRAGALGEERDAGTGPCAAAPRAIARQLDARRDVDPDRRDVAERFRDVRRRQAAGQDDRHLAGDRRGERDRRRAGPCRPGAARRRCRGGAARHRRRGRRDRDAASRAAAERHVRRRLGREVEDLPDRASDRARSRPAPAVRAGRRRGRRSPRWRARSAIGGIRGDGDDRRPARGGRRGPDRPWRATAASPSDSARGVPGTTLSPMASAPAEIAAIALPASVMPQILTQRPSRDVGRVGRGAPRGDERADGRGGSAAPHQRLADERGVEAERPPAGDRRGVADARTRRPPAGRRGRAREAGRPARGRPRASAGRGC